MDSLITQGVFSPKRPSIKIAFHNHDSPTAPVYTTGSIIAGTVTLTAPHLLPLPFSEFSIQLLGTTRTQGMDQIGRAPGTGSKATHTFLRLSMPIKSGALPEDGVLPEGSEYEIPFSFTVPSTMLPTACRHPIVGPHVCDAHLRLPPSLGESRQLLGAGGHDDMAPEMTKIAYSVVAKLVRWVDPETDEHDVPASTSQVQTEILGQQERKVVILPSQPETAPLHITERDEEGFFNSSYVTSKSKTVKKGVFSGALGRITVSAAQPAAVLIDPAAYAAGTYHAQPGTSGITTAHLNVRFDPAAGSNGAMPRIGSIVYRIKSTTFHGVRGVKELPDEQVRIAPHEASTSAYSTTVMGVPLKECALVREGWVRQEERERPPVYERRDSGYSTASLSSAGTSPLPSPGLNADGTVPSAASYLHVPGQTITPSLSTKQSKQNGPATDYTTTLRVPITLPPNKLWLPTFHSCLVSRWYVLSLEVQIHPPAKGVPSFCVGLRVPLQICVKPLPGLGLGMDMGMEMDVGMGGDDGLPTFASLHLRPNPLVRVQSGTSSFSSGGGASEHTDRSLRTRRSDGSLSLSSGPASPSEEEMGERERIASIASEVDAQLALEGCAAAAAATAPLSLSPPPDYVASFSGRSPPPREGRRVVVR